MRKFPSDNGKSSQAIADCYFSAPPRHAAVDLHLRQMRSPAHALGNGERQIRHCLIFASAARSGSGSPWQLPVPVSSAVSLHPGNAFAPSLRLVTTVSLGPNRNTNREGVNDAPFGCSRQEPAMLESVHLVGGTARAARHQGTLVANMGSRHGTIKNVVCPSSRHQVRS